MRLLLVGGVVLAGCAHVQTRELDPRTPRDAAAPIAVLDELPRGSQVVATMVADGTMSKEAFLDEAAAAARRVGADALVVSLAQVKVKGRADGAEAAVVVGIVLVVVILLPLALLAAVAGGGAGGFNLLSGLGGLGGGVAGNGASEHLEWQYSAKAIAFGTGELPQEETESEPRPATASDPTPPPPDMAANPSAPPLVGLPVDRSGEPSGPLCNEQEIAEMRAANVSNEAIHSACNF